MPIDSLFWMIPLPNSQSSLEASAMCFFFSMTCEVEILCRMIPWPLEARCSSKVEDYPGPRRIWIRAWSDLRTPTTATEIRRPVSRATSQRPVLPWPIRFGPWSCSPRHRRGRCHRRRSRQCRGSRASWSPASNPNPCRRCNRPAPPPSGRCAKSARRYSRGAIRRSPRFGGRPS